MRSRENDAVLPSFNKDFSPFSFDQNLQQIVNDFPPVSVPFGTFDISPDTEVLLYQKVGSIISTKPLLVVNGTQRPKTAIMLGSGIWQWRLQENAQRDSQQAFNTLITKIVQYLSTRDDKRKFRVYPIKKEFDDLEPVVVETEVYNDLFERIYGHRVELTVTDAEGKSTLYTYTTARNNSQYQLSRLNPGVYRYTAKTKLDNSTEITSGAFTVKKLQLEHLNLTADHQMLRTLAKRSGGEFFTKDQMDELDANLANQKAEGIIHSSEQFLSLIELKWLFFTLLFLVSMEWFIRKYHGGY
ncbi:hypothetical protein E1171_00685 [Cytophagales bacterium RKSG123]|nr:hypothetical protein [Xanthovirga aplysinae]